MTRRRASIQAEYNQGTDIDTKLLENVIPEYERDLLVRMIQECKAVVEDAHEIGLTRSSGNTSFGIVPWTIKGANREPTHHTIKFTSPVVQYIPSTFASLHLRCKFVKTYDVEYIPCYLMNLNRVALAKFYPKSYLSACDSIGNGLFRRLDFRGKKRVTLSSLNILLPGYAEERVQDSGQEVIRKCFEYCWWHLPAPKDMEDTSCMHNMPYHKSRRIKGILQIRKTLLRVIKIRKSDTRSILPGGKAVKCAHADVALLVDDGKRIFSEKRGILISENVLHSTKEDDFMNAIIVVQGIKSPKISMVMGHAAEPTQPADMRPVLSLAMWKILQHMEIGSSLTRVGDLDTIVDFVSGILENNAREIDVFYPRFAWKFTKSDAKRVISDIFPLYVRDGNSAYQLPPAVIACLLTTAPSILANVESVRAVARLFDLVSTDTMEWKKNAQLALEPPENQGMSSSSDLDRLLLRIPSVAVEVALSRIFSKYAVSTHQCS